MNHVIQPKITKTIWVNHSSCLGIKQNTCLCKYVAFYYITLPQLLVLYFPTPAHTRAKHIFFGGRIQTWCSVDVGTKMSSWNTLHLLNQWPCPALSIWLITQVFPHYVNNFMSSAEHSINLWRNPALHPDRYTLSVLPAVWRLWEPLFWNLVKTFTTHFTHTGSTGYFWCSTLKEKQCGQSENKWNRTKAKKTYLRRPAWQNKSTLQHNR